MRANKCLTGICAVILFAAETLAQFGRDGRQCRCVPLRDCTSIRNLPWRERDRWMTENSCTGPRDEESFLFSYAPASRESHVCCPSDDSRRPTTERSPFQGNQRQTNQGNVFQGNQGSHNQGSAFQGRSASANQQQQNRRQNQQDGSNNFGTFNNGRGNGSSNSSLSNQDAYGNGQRRNFNSGNDQPSFANAADNLPTNTQNTQDSDFNDSNSNFTQEYAPSRGFFRQIPNLFGNIISGVRNIFSGAPNTFNLNARQNVLGQNPYFIPQNQNQNRGPFVNGGGAQTSGFQNQPQSGECSGLTSFPPEANTGCCGKDPSDSDRIIGGQVTEIDQFPWTVLLKTTFAYRDRDAAFNCGGSLISARYVLTAAHCVSDPEARVKDVEVTLAEYDKRTFPNDCVYTYEGRRCTKNIVTHAEDVIAHAEFDDTGLKNDIALLRLPTKVPYSDFIRPICLPPLDIDTPGLSNLPLSVAGWGRNGEYESNVKQSTVVRLVPQRECRRSYSQLNRLHLCAAGNTGEDTCKGDSGGPLMILYEGRYFVSGIVSGKRADSPCGTSVPSLYTNVYRYVDWIRSHIRN